MRHLKRYRGGKSREIRIINDMPAFLCWKGGEEDILYWHYFDEGFSGRKKISGKERILEPL